MNRYHINIKLTAENDLENRYVQIAEDSPQNALNWYLSIVGAIEKLDTMAKRCPIASENEDIRLGIRHLIIGSYRVLYKIDGDMVNVLHVRHSAKKRVL